jgi:hypothetical protein
VVPAGRGFKAAHNATFSPEPKPNVWIEPMDEADETRNYATEVIHCPSSRAKLAGCSKAGLGFGEEGSDADCDESMQPGWSAIPQ